MTSKPKREKAQRCTYCGRWIKPDILAMCQAWWCCYHCGATLPSLQGYHLIVGRAGPSTAAPDPAKNVAKNAHVHRTPERKFNGTGHKRPAGGKLETDE